MKETNIILYCVVGLVVVFGLIMAFILIKNLVSGNRKRKTTKIVLLSVVSIVVVICLVFLGVLIFGHPLGEKEYHEDLYIEVPGMTGKIIVKEWSYLLGSGEDIYYLADNSKKPKLIGKLTGGDDGYCPFADGKYTVTYVDGSLLFSWSFNREPEPYSRSQTIVLPVE